MLIGLLPWWFPFQASLQSGEFRLHVLDVGQGQAVIVQTADHLLLYDAGPAWPDGWNTAQAIIWPMLGQMGAHRIDRIMISHADNDHAGGLGWLRQQFPDTPVLQTGLPGQGQRCQQGEQWHWNGVRFSVLHPGNAIEAGNNGSCVLRVDNGRFVALLPGDIERAIEYRLLAEQPDALQADWLLAPHHGSRTSSSWPWAKAVSPKQVVYSAGYRNRFGHPAEDIVRRWQQLGAQSLQTAHCGTYSMRVDSQGQWQQRCYRTAWKPWWRDL
jgi:competence protein ComEC